MQLDANFNHLTSVTPLFRQRWKAKTLTRAYHGDQIGEKIFRRWYVPKTLPDVRPRKITSQTSIGLKQWARKDDVAQQERKRLEAEEKKGVAPVGSLMFTEVERRIDVLIFRACMAPSVYDARRMVVHGAVLLNGVKVWRVLVVIIASDLSIAHQCQYTTCPRGHGLCRPEGYHFPPAAETLCCRQTTISV